MYKILQINTVSNSRSTGKIAERIGKVITENGWESFIASGRRLSGISSSSNQIFIGNSLDYNLHAIGARLTDGAGLFSVQSTEKFVKQIDNVRPDLVHLHNLHGYYLNIKILFEYLQSKKLPVVWTFHDCWPYTGHCAYYSFSCCDQWKSECIKCPETGSYPKSWLDFSRRNFKLKKELFTGLENLTICTPSAWLAGEVKKSFFEGTPVYIINNGIDLKLFKPSASSSEDLKTKYQVQGRTVILGVASVWNSRKGLQDFERVYKLLDREKFKIILVGVSPAQSKELPEGLICISRTENQAQLAELYSMADIFFNPTYEDNFPTTNIEALACGTPVLTYRTGGSPEIIDAGTGWVTDQGDFDTVAAILSSELKEKYTAACRKRAVEKFDGDTLFQKYLVLYQEKLSV